MSGVKVASVKYQTHKVQSTFSVLEAVRIDKLKINVVVIYKGKVR